MTELEKYSILEKDYDRKNEQLHRHLTSLWVRFNFFLTFQGIIVGSKFFLIHDNSSIPFDFGMSILALFVSIIWYFFAANDRYLVKVYRSHVDSAHQRLLLFLDGIKICDLSGSEFLMQTTSNTKIKMNILGWRNQNVGLTDYATMTPLVISLFWLGEIIYHIFA